MGPLFKWGPIEEKIGTMMHILRIRKKGSVFLVKNSNLLLNKPTKTNLTNDHDFHDHVFLFCVMASLSIQCVCILRRAQLLAPNVLDHL